MSNYKTLYLGLDPSHYESQENLFHFPIIKILPRPFLPKIFFQTGATHILFTSKTAVSLFFDVVDSLNNIHVIAVGKRTQETIEKRGFLVSYVAQEETQEGVIAELEKIDIGHLFFPHSALSRPVIFGYLQNKKIPFTSYVLYDVDITDAPPPSLDPFEEIVFTSPSTA
jgi:uroporphyrinogen-III synthase